MCTMARPGHQSSEDIKLSSDEVVRLKKAFADPEFRKLFKDYADEISDPANRKKYEEDIREMEAQQGMDVEFINPTPGHCLKSRHWPTLSATTSVGTAAPCELIHTFCGRIESSREEGAKVFINVCKSEKVGCPVMKAVKNTAGRQVPNGCCWNLPHCFTPPREDLDRNKKRAMVFDVAFHPKAFDLSSTSPAMHRLMDVSAIEGVQRQFGLCLGKSIDQATQLTQLIKSTRDPTTDALKDPIPESATNRAECVAREDALLRAVHKLKGTTYKGVAKPSVIRRRRTDYDERQSELRKRTDDEVAECQDPLQKEAIKKLASMPYAKPAGMEQSNEARSCNNATAIGPREPAYRITYSSDYDMINSRDAPDINPLRPPDRLRIACHLPGIVSSGCLDLDLTTTHLNLTSQKPVAYTLNLKLPYPVDDTNGVAKFDKAANTLSVTVPLLRQSDNAQPNNVEVQPVVSPISQGCDSTPISPIPPTNEGEPSPTSSDDRPSQLAMSHCTKRKRRRKHRRRRSSASDTGNDSDTLKNSNTEHEQPQLISVDETATTTITCGDELKENVRLETDVEKGGDKPIPNALHPSSQIEPFVPSSKIGHAAQTAGNSIPISQIGYQQLIVSKDRRLAPVRFRQDPFSLSVLLPVRGILANSISLQWTVEPVPDGQDKSDSEGFEDMLLADEESPITNDRTHMDQRPSPQLLLLLHFSSRGAGGCTMDWGLVLRCPSTARSVFHSGGGRSAAAAAVLLNHNQPIKKNRPYRHFYQQTPPRLISSNVSATSAVLTFEKPFTETKSGHVKGDSGESLHRLSDSTFSWWSSVAIGRTLAAGMEEYSFIGVDNCLSTQTTAPYATLAPASDGMPPHGLVHLDSLSSDHCIIDWNRSSAMIDTAKYNNTASLQPPTTNGPMDTSPTTTRQRAMREFERRSVAALKGILKQRSVSESSGDEAAIPIARSAATTIGGVCGNGLTDSHYLSSDEFPTASSEEDDDDEEEDPATTTVDDNLANRSHPNHRPAIGRLRLHHLRRCVSNEKLPSSVPTDMEQTYPGNGKPGRQRRRSVNFSPHDQQLAYSPRDTVEHLHHALANRRKKARRRETKTHKVRDDKTPSSATTVAKHTPKLADRKLNHLQLSSGNNSLTETQAVKINTAPHVDDAPSIADSGDHPSADSSSETPISAPPSPTSAVPVADQSESSVTCGQSNMLSVVENGVTHAVSNVHHCPISLSAMPILELDEE